MKMNGTTGWMIGGGLLAAIVGAPMIVGGATENWALASAGLAFGGTALGVVTSLGEMASAHQANLHAFEREVGHSPTLRESVLNAELRHVSLQLGRWTLLLAAAVFAVWAAV